MIVVTGATGNVGRTLVRLLAEAGEEVTAVSRRITGADVPPGVRAVAADLSDPAGLPDPGGLSDPVGLADPAGASGPGDLSAPGDLRPVLAEADALFLLTGGDLFATEPKEIVAGLRGPGRVVLLSSQGVVTRPDSPSHGRWGAELERALTDSGVRWTILRPGGFASNTFAWAGSIRARRTVAAPFGDVGLPVIDPDDIAEVAATVLREPGHDGRIYELTGPETVTPRRRAEIIGEALGEKVTFVEQSREEARAEMLAFMPEPVADTTLAILGEPNEAEVRVSPDVERVLGRAPRPFAAWAGRNVAAFR
ncbi:NAD(P)H-binding protein [Nonomuraea phyllanthi]|uniref:NAD(P)H-binding protein n=1 Tax=Nonomuraea phyllanthi TaxID=2219224 RepID=A0A5C4W9E9_9ACTN|nr:NAD(P)H-binding protein [Nonomuraea phyllanthi]KAB8192737.1 NAD(P)H-binding protein [Nonomuraea phyllanthi]